MAFSFLASVLQRCSQSEIPGCTSGIRGGGAGLLPSRVEDACRAAERADDPVLVEDRYGGARFIDPIFYSRFSVPEMNCFPHLGHSRCSPSTRLQSASWILESQCGQVVICNSLILSQLSLRQLGILRAYRTKDDADVPGGQSARTSLGNNKMLGIIFRCRAIPPCGTKAI